ncbi:hypothetical protein Ade02nite_15030 [Paractinoplanes deccanensis]|uniref:Uncharacterized protein n=1 Tax=Paractinoplanes deccanensis TaxID=113561 RepID=A0ABQ3XYX9_9ACTN|nr:hypothetical protein [Actinoplanes deccanensis]GID72862.1 hypothetical protein Ade02nite_15030 [Actinoplanes deccanensis]
MTVHVGELTSEVVAAGEPPTRAPEVSIWEERQRLRAALERIERDRCRTATGEDGHD